MYIGTHVHIHNETHIYNTIHTQQNTHLQYNTHTHFSHAPTPQAVNVPELRYLVNVAVFPQLGNRPHCNEASGGDFDGYGVVWVGMGVTLMGMLTSLL